MAPYEWLAGQNSPDGGYVIFKKKKKKEEEKKIKYMFLIRAPAVHVTVCFSFEGSEAGGGFSTF